MVYTSAPQKISLMSQNIQQDYLALEGAIVPTFIKYLIPSLVGLLAMTSASVVDGIFIGNYVGVTALAAVNLVIPITTLVFGLGMMLSVGGAVRAGKFLGEKDVEAASATFSKTMVVIAGTGTALIALALVFEESLFRALGASEDLFPVMAEYYRIIMPFMFAELVVLVLYYFIRLDGMPNLVASALAAGSLLNIGLDYVFIGLFDWGLTGAAYATGLSYSLHLLIMSVYFFLPKRKMQFSVWQKNWTEVFRAAYNGISEFINEISGGVVAFIFNWMLIQRAGVDGVAAISVVNYVMMIGFMVYFSISDTISVLVSQNYGARDADRVSAFLKTAVGTVFLVSALFITALITASEPIILMFVEEESSEEMVAMAMEFVNYVWPLFLFAGTNMMISAYLTAIHRPLESSVVALCRSLVLPGLFLGVFYMSFEGYLFVVALPVAETVTFIIAGLLFLKFRPSRTVPNR